MEEVTKFDPSKQWQWKLDDEIVLTGRQFSILNQALSQFVVSSLDVPTIIKLTEAFTICQAKMAEYVEKGVITEFVPEQNS
jgi:hypothetical protein